MVSSFRQIIKRIITISKKIFSREVNSVPLLIITKEKDDDDIKEYNSIEEAIIDLENDPNVPKEKIKKLKLSLKNLKYKTIIKIRNGELIK